MWAAELGFLCGGGNEGNKRDGAGVGALLTRDAASQGCIGIRVQAAASLERCPACTCVVSRSSSVPEARRKPEELLKIIAYYFSHDASAPSLSLPS